MKIKNIISAIALAAIITLPSMAEITPAEAMSSDYLINHGHSEETARLMQLSNKQIKGIPTESAKSEMSLPVRWYRKVQGYLDPSIDDGTFGTTEIHTKPSMEDL